MIGIFLWILYGIEWCISFSLGSHAFGVPYWFPFLQDYEIGVLLYCPSISNFWTPYFVFLLLLVYETSQKTTSTQKKILPVEDFEKIAFPKQNSPQKDPNEHSHLVYLLVHFQKIVRRTWYSMVDPNWHKQQKKQGQADNTRYHKEIPRMISVRNGKNISEKY